jgi:hypothetical protein
MDNWDMRESSGTSSIMKPHRRAWSGSSGTAGIFGWKRLRVALRVAEPIWAGGSLTLAMIWAAEGAGGADGVFGGAGPSSRASDTRPEAHDINSVLKVVPRIVVTEGSSKVRYPAS